jgi:hypothetical protein
MILQKDTINVQYLNQSDMRVPVAEHASLQAVWKVSNTLSGLYSGRCQTLSKSLKKCQILGQRFNKNSAFAAFLFSLFHFRRTCIHFPCKCFIFPAFAAHDFVIASFSQGLHPFSL